MSSGPIIETDIVSVSNINDYYNWKTRKLIGIRTKSRPDEWFYSVHYGWWNDAEEPFQDQWRKTQSHLNNRPEVWLMGDFNNPAEIRNEGYDMIESSGWYDSYVIADYKDSGITVGTAIDGWREKNYTRDGMRIDHIWCSKKAEVMYSQVIFNNINYPVISDHYGVLIKYR